MFDLILKKEIAILLSLTKIFIKNNIFKKKNYC